MIYSRCGPRVKSIINIEYVFYENVDKKGYIVNKCFNWEEILVIGTAHTSLAIYLLYGNVEEANSNTFK